MQSVSDQLQCYRPLDTAKKEIRVLRLLEKHVTTPAGNRVQFCNFEYLSLNDVSDPCTISELDEAYDAISWCWGEVVYNACIYVDGHLLHIPENAWEVIESLCVRQRILRIWIDAVCINQHDLDERSQQVALMQEVYRQARHVLIWLGNEVPFTKPAVESLQEIVRQCYEATDNLATPLPELEKSSEPLPDNVDWHAIADFLDEPWFERLWCFQEAALATSAICFQGTYYLLWDDLIAACHWMYHRQFNREAYAGPLTMPTLYKLKSMHVDSPTNWDLTRLITQTCGTSWKTTDPRDRVYVVLGLYKFSTTLDPSIGKLLLPDYRRTAARVFADATGACIMESRSLYPLAFCSLYKPTPEQDPSRSGFPS